VRLPAKLIAHPILTVVLVLAFAGVAIAAVPAFNASETPRFCTTCHEMRPYYDAWAAGAHKSVSCVECHVDAGTVSHVEHKVTAAKELWTHLSGDPRFPQSTADVPDSRCLTCHPDIMKATGPKFSHKAHASTGPCVECHSETGHKVTLGALAEAGVLKPGLETSGAATVASTAVVARAASPTDASALPVHPEVSCAKCHDLTQVACSTCHQPAHEQRGECATCHEPGGVWTFSHPASQECATCHDAPAKHFATDCASCHSAGVAFAATTFRHASTDCASCQTPPSPHNRKVACSSCHKKAGVSWAFSHPGASSCASCHSAPSGHYGSSCARCHTPSVAFKQAVYRHVSSACSSCHRAPSGHVRSVSCSTCHRKAGTSWAASHPASRACASCHKPPANHFGTTCASCHKPLVAWTRATFKHPSAGEHSYRSFACAKCHPSGYSSHSCTCHGGNPPSGD
jgi:nitrate/TMAO reductase-like tetraheme cytochrome c subunit